MEVKQLFSDVVRTGTFLLFILKIQQHIDLNRHTGSNRVTVTLILPITVNDFTKTPGLHYRVCPFFITYSTVLQSESVISLVLLPVPVEEI